MEINVLRVVKAVGGKKSSYIGRRKLRMEPAGRRPEEEHTDETREDLKAVGVRKEDGENRVT